MKFNWRKISIILIIVIVVGVVFYFRGISLNESEIEKFTNNVLANEEYSLNEQQLTEFKHKIKSEDIPLENVGMLQQKYFYLGYIENLLGHEQESIGYYKEAYSLGQNDDPLINFFMISAVARSYLQAGDKEEADKAFQQILDYVSGIDEDIEAKAFQAYARNLVAYSNNINKAIELMKGATKLNSLPETSAYNHLYLASLYLGVNNHYEAINESIVALEISNKYKLEVLKGASVKSLGDIYYIQRKYDQAISLYEELLQGHYKLNTTDQLAYLGYLADCYAMVNKFELAQQLIDLYKDVSEQLSGGEKVKELNWIYLLQAKLDLLQGDTQAASEAVGIANDLSNDAANNLYANVDVWSQQLLLDLALVENGGDYELLNQYINLLDEMKRRNVYDDLYYTIRDKVIYVGDMLGETELTNEYRKEKIADLEKNETVNYETEIMRIIEEIHHARSQEIIVSLKSITLIIATFSIFMLGSTIHIHLARRKIRKLNDVLYEQSITDYLTKAYNRKYLSEYAEHLVSNHRELTCMLLDIDYFKLYNDTYGHLAGDEILKHVSQLLLEVFSEDAVFRYGGEEFCVISTETLDRFEAKVETLYDKLIALNLEHNSSKVAKRVTISAGICREEVTNNESLIKQLKLADDKLYHAKESGRNQFVI